MHVLQIVQKIQVVLDKTRNNASKTAQLEVEKKKLATALEAKKQKLKEEAKKNIALFKEAEVEMDEICKIKAETHKLKGEIKAKEKRAAELEAVAKAKAKLEAFI